MLDQELSVKATDSATHSQELSSGQRPSIVMGLASLVFILLQSACSAVMAISGLRLLIGIGSFAAATSVMGALDAMHGDWFRLPMTVLGLAGSLINLYVIWRIRSLRLRPSSQWRKATLSPEKQRSETIQLSICYATLLLLAIEWLAHWHLFGTLI